MAPGSPVRVRRVAEQLGRQFHQESRFDFPPYLADDPEDQVVVLIPSQSRRIAYGGLFAGAVGVDPAIEFRDLPSAVPVVAWAYLHPYERGAGLVERLWPALLERWPGTLVPGPYTGAGRALVRRLVAAGLQPAELVHGA